MMKAGVLLLGVLCLIAFCNGEVSETEVKNAALHCCNVACSLSKLQYLHDMLSVYKSSPNVNAEVANFGDSVLGGLRCDNHDVVARATALKEVATEREKRFSSVLSSAGITSPNKAARANNTQILSLTCPTAVYVSGPTSFNCTAYVYNRFGIVSLQFSTIPSLSGYNLQYNLNNQTGPFYLPVTFFVDSSVRSQNVSVQVSYNAANGDYHSTGSLVPLIIQNGTTNGTNFITISCPSYVNVWQSNFFNCTIYAYDPMGISLVGTYDTLGNGQAAGLLNATSYTLVATFPIYTIDVSSPVVTVYAYYNQIGTGQVFTVSTNLTLDFIPNIYIYCPSQVSPSAGTFTCQFLYTSSVGSYRIDVAPQATTYGPTSGNITNVLYFPLNITFAINGMVSQYTVGATLNDSDGITYYTEATVYVIGNNNTSSITLSCPSYAYSPGQFVCTTSIQDSNGISQAYLGNYGGFPCDGCSYYNYNSTNSTSTDVVFNSVFYLSGNQTVTGTYEIFAYYYNGYGNFGQIVYANITIQSNSTPPPPSNDSITLYCPSNGEVNEPFDCDVYIISSSPVSYSFVTTNNNTNNTECDGCVQYGVDFYNVTIIAYNTGVVVVSATFFNDNGQFFSNSVTVYISGSAGNNSITLDEVFSPSVVGVGSYGQVQFNITAAVSSTYPIYYSFVYYSGPSGQLSGSTFGYQGYYINFNVQSFGAVAPGTYCPTFFFEDIYGNYAYLNSTTCVQVTDANCDAGFYISANNSECVACPRGFYSDSRNSPYCTACPNGYTSSCVLGSRSCVPCPAGTTSQNGVCQPCGAGTFSNWDGQDSCTDCAAGSYSNAPGSTYCLSCPGGTYSCAGAKECKACAPGTYSSWNSEICAQCLPGTFSYGGANSTFCQQCPSNTYAGRGASSCRPCPPGKSSQPGSFACVASR